MIQITFHEDSDARAAAGSTENKIHFELQTNGFENQTFCFAKDALLFDGYSIWYEDRGTWFRQLEDFSVSFQIAPLGYSDQGDGLFSLFDREKREGFYILIKKFGKVQVGFGNGREVFAFESIRSNLRKNSWNGVTVVFRKREGWCDLYINGILSNRRQFRRHMPVTWPKTTAYLGKYVDHADYDRNAEAGCFYGLIRNMTVYEKSIAPWEAVQLQNACPVGQVSEEGFLDRNIFRKDRQRPKYHLIAPGKWMNEPHAPLFFEGWYHIFYQANTHAPSWNNIQWGHMISRDMVHWTDLPLALETEKPLDPDGCWSGSALVDRQGQPRIFYTAGNNERFPNQSVAMAAAIVGEDRQLRTWIKEPFPVVEQTIGWKGEFRDPFVWTEKDHYFMLVGTGDENNGGGNAVLYSSGDLFSWECHGFLAEYDYEKNREVGHVWELPVLLPLKNESGETACSILLFCACQVEKDVVETYGFLGRWDAERRKFEKFHEKALLLDLGNGTFTGPSGLVTPDGRSVVFSIAQGKRKRDEEYHAGWAHNGGLPIELFLRNGELHLRPVREILSLRSRQIIHLTEISMEQANDYLGRFEGNCVYLKVVGDAERILLETEDGDQKKTVYYDKSRCRLGVLDKDGKEIGKYRGAEDQVRIGEEPVSMEYFLDQSMIEVYLNEKKSVTVRNYGNGSARKIRLAGNVEKIRKLELWEMEPAYALEKDLEGRVEYE